MKKYRVLREPFFDYLEDLHELKSSSTLHQNVNLVLSNQAYSTPSAQDQTDFASDAFTERKSQITVTLTSSAMASGPYGRTFFPDECSSIRTKASVGKRRC